MPIRSVFSWSDDWLTGLPRTQRQVYRNLRLIEPILKHKYKFKWIPVHPNKQNQYHPTAVTKQLRKAYGGNIDSKRIALACVLSMGKNNRILPADNIFFVMKGDVHDKLGLLQFLQLTGLFGGHFQVAMPNEVFTMIHIPIKKKKGTSINLLSTNQAH